MNVYWATDVHLIRTSSIPNRITSIAVTSDGHIVVVSGQDDGLVRFVRLDDGQIINTLPASQLAVWKIALSPDNQIIASAASEGVVQLWSTTTSERLHILAPPYKGGGQVEDLEHPGINLAHTIEAVTFSPDGTLVAAGGANGEVWIWRVADRRLLYTFYGHIGLGGYDNPITNVSFSPDGQIIASAGLDDTVYIWSLKEGHMLHRLGNPSDLNERRAIAFSPNGQLLATGGDTENVEVWSVPQGQLVATLSDKQSGAFSLAWSHDGRLLAAGGGIRLDDGVATRPYDMDIRIWDIQTQQVKLRLHGHTGNVTGIFFMPDGRTLVSGSEDKSIRIWNVKF